MEQSHSSIRGAQKNYDYDLIVIGGGSGGVAAARRAAMYGAQVLLIEGKRLGGTCVNVGCVPKKVMFNAATVSDTINSAHEFGFSVENVSLDWSALKQKRDTYIARLNDIYKNNLHKSGVTVIQGYASFVDKHTVKIRDSGETYTGENMLVAVGGSPRIPNIPGKEHVISSDGFFDLDHCPPKVAVVGGGYIGVELAGMLASLGSKVTIYVRSIMLHVFDKLVQEKVKQDYEEMGIVVREQTDIHKIDKQENGQLSLTYQGHEASDSQVDTDIDVVLYAIGRVPQSKELNLEAAGVEVTNKGHIKVDLPTSQTTSDNIYAVGDVIGAIDLTPVAIAAGRTVADRLFGPQTRKNATIDYTLVPSVVFAHPPVGTCGLTEEAARKCYGDGIKVYTSTFVNLWYGPWEMEPSAKPKSHVKLICVGQEERVVGLHITGMAADEILQGFGVAMRMGATKSDFDACIAIHPTAAEELVTMAPWNQGTQVPRDRSLPSGAAVAECGDIEQS